MTAILEERPATEGWICPRLILLSASLYFSKRGAYRLCRDVVGCYARALWPNGAS